MKDKIQFNDEIFDLGKSQKYSKYSDLNGFRF